MRKKDGGWSELKRKEEKTGNIIIAIAIGGGVLTLVACFVWILIAGGIC